MLSALLMFHRLMRALSHALREEEFGPVLSAATTLVVVGTVVYALGEGWSVTDSLYFAVATLTTSSIADPGLELTDPWLKVFTAIYILTGIGVLVEVVRRLGMGFVAVMAEDRAAQAARRQQKAGGPRR